MSFVSINTPLDDKAATFGAARALLLIMVGSLASGLTFVASGQELLGDPEAGRELAQQQCAACHYVEGYRVRLTRTIPSFGEIAAKRSSSAVNLRDFLRSRHEPQLVLRARSANDIVAYILSLQAPPKLPALPPR